MASMWEPVPDGFKLGILANPTRECVSHGVLANGEARFAAKVLHEFAAAQVGFRERPRE